MVRVGVIGGSGVYAMRDARVIREISLETPFGAPSDRYILVDIGGLEVVFLPRHGRGHLFNPSEVNYRANIYGMKMLGVQWIIAVSAVGSLQEEIVPGHVVLIDQFIDRTFKRSHTFFEQGVVGHVGFGHPVCGVLHAYLEQCCAELGVKHHAKGTYVNMEGPAFSTIAESNLYRSWNAQVIGMTALTEAKLAREAEISYSVLAMATDYDCWREGEAHVSVDAVVAVLKENSAIAQNIVRLCVQKIYAHAGPDPVAWSALKTAVMTDPSRIPAAQLVRLAPLLGRYLPAPQDHAATGLLLFGAVTAAILAWAHAVRA